MQEKRTRIIVEIGVAVALSAIFNLIPLWKMPQGGSVSLEMLPIFIIAFRWGGIPGITAGFIYGLLQLTMGAYIVHPLQVLMDYPVPYMLVGLAGFISPVKYEGIKRAFAIIIAILFGGILRFIAHVVSGAVFFAHFAPEGQNPWLYSAVYNAGYIVLSLLICALLIFSLFKKLILANRD